MEINWETIRLLGGHLLGHYLLILLLYVVLFGFLALAISVLQFYVVHRYKLLKRQHRTYHWAIKTVYPYLLCVNLYFIVSIGVAFGCRNALQKDLFNIGYIIYKPTAQYLLKDRVQKDELVDGLRDGILELQKQNQMVKDSLVQLSEKVKIKYGVVNTAKNGLAKILIEQYGDEIYSRAFYASAFLGTDGKIEEAMTYEEFDEALEYLLSIEPNELEKIIIENLGKGVTSLIRPQINSVILTYFLLWLLMIALPAIEMVVYRKLQ